MKESLILFTVFLSVSSSFFPEISVNDSGDYEGYIYSPYVGKCVRDVFQNPERIPEFHATLEECEETRPTDTYYVESVVDANSIVVIAPGGKRETVALIGLDVPEAFPSEDAKRYAEYSGQDVTELWESLTRRLDGLSDQEVFLEFDVQKRDKQGRLLAYVFTKHDNSYEGHITTIRREDGIQYDLVNADIVAEGLSEPVTNPSNMKYVDLFLKVYASVKKERRLAVPFYEEVVLGPGGNCTLSGCNKRNPCCNYCTHDRSWGGVGAYFKAIAINENFPECEMDGCGNCTFVIRASGYRSTSDFYVDKWSKADPNSQEIIDMIKAQTVPGFVDRSAVEIDEDKTHPIEEKAEEGVVFVIPIDKSMFSKNATITVSLYNAHQIDIDSKPSRRCSKTYDPQTRIIEYACPFGARYQETVPEEFLFPISEIGLSIQFTTQFVKIGEKYSLHVSGLNTDDCNTTAATFKGKVLKNRIELAAPAPLRGWYTTLMWCGGKLFEYE